MIMSLNIRQLTALCAQVCSLSEKDLAIATKHLTDTGLMENSTNGCTILTNKGKVHLEQIQRLSLPRTVFVNDEGEIIGS